MKTKAALLLILMLTMPSASPSAFAQAASEIPKPMTDLNDGFRRAYADAKTRMLATADPVIIAGTDAATLIANGRRSEGRINTPLYHALKTVAHVPLAIFVALTPHEETLDAARLDTLARLAALIPPARASLASLNLPAAVLARQETILGESLSLIDAARSQRNVSLERLAAFLRTVGQPVGENTADATHAQLDALHAQVSAWRRDLTPEAWSRLHVIVVGAHMPRDGAIVLQCFSRLLKEPVEGERIVYAESLWEEPRALDLLATHLLDGSVGEAFFGDFMRMHRDLLADDGREYLLKLLPEYRPFGSLTLAAFDQTAAHGSLRTVFLNRDA
jgi:hypothetical protein